MKKHIAEQLLEDFYKRYKYNHTIDKCFAIQASSRYISIFDINRVKALIFKFCINNIRSFHKIDGSDYNFWMSYIIKIDTIN
ncbi:aminopeptidase N C-terminal domain-containing protein [Candidatus Kinetoplastibacterium sorsogonicusi]|uniref:aminopeptidase N C-terminal domain-containing protein n=1 Tax=Candidatus Kinetoplastidibacterium kentomonadis TaxID=1576550 RepID=UPI000D3E5935|nr:aminopeptidase N C-terminal domain-containing protein [Candidatus Kinetoplastibacterium sorsogonicusi]